MSDSAIFPADDEAAAPDTKAERAASILQRAVLTGELPPGSKLRVNDLMKVYGLGATPLREGLSRLVAAGLVEASSQRGFRVVPISRTDLDDIIRTRTLVEIEALRLSMQRGDDDWEAAIVAALYRLNKFFGKAVPDARELDEFDAVHKAFHMALLAACGSPRLLDMSVMLYDQTFRYRQLVRTQMMARRAPADEHQALADAVISRDFATASDLLRRHLEITGVLAGSEADIAGSHEPVAD